MFKVVLPGKVFWVNVKAVPSADLYSSLLCYHSQQRIPDKEINRYNERIIKTLQIYQQRRPCIIGFVPYTIIYELQMCPYDTDAPTFSLFTKLKKIQTDRQGQI